jgi:hypothetical protein
VAENAKHITYNEIFLLLEALMVTIVDALFLLIMVTIVDALNLPID